MTPLIFPFVVKDPLRGRATAVPELPVRLTREGRFLDAGGRLDTGASVCVLPHALGLALGAKWAEQTMRVQLSGNLAGVDARALSIDLAVGHFTPVEILFAWAASDDVPLLLGQINFFLEFDVCFRRSRGTFDVRPKS